MFLFKANDKASTDYLPVVLPLVWLRETETTVSATLNVDKDVIKDLSIGGKIRYYRELSGLTRQALADMVGVDPHTIIQLEHNRQKTFRPLLFEILKKISECLDVDWRLLADDYVLSIYGDFSERIKQYMDKNNISQIELSRLLSVHPQTIAVWVKNKDKPSRKSWELMKQYNII